MFVHYYTCQVNDYVIKYSYNGRRGRDTKSARSISEVLIMAQKYTEARKEGNRRWDAANLDRLSIAVPKGKKDIIKAHAESMGESVNAFIIRAIDDTIERDGSK